MPVNLFFSRRSEPSNHINKLLIFKRTFWKTNPIKIGNNFHKSPELLIKKCEKSFPFFIDFQMKSSILSKNP
jgi:hypothetical protein